MLCTCNMSTRMFQGPESHTAYNPCGWSQRDVSLSCSRTCSLISPRLASREQAGEGVLHTSILALTEKPDQEDGSTGYVYARPTSAENPVVPGQHFLIMQCSKDRLQGDGTRQACDVSCCKCGWGRAATRNNPKIVTSIASHTLRFCRLTPVFRLTPTPCIPSARA